MGPKEPTYKWVDESSYPRNATPEERVPSIWELRLDGIRIVVHRWLSLTDIWFLSCRELNLERVNLLSKDVEAAKAEALEHVDNLLSKMADEVKSVRR